MTGSIKMDRNETGDARPVGEAGLRDERCEPIQACGFRHFLFYGGPVLAYAALIFSLSSLSSFPDEVPSFFGFDKIAHFTEYSFLGCLLYRWCSATNRYRNGRGALLMTILIGIGYALSDEWHQSFVPGRDASPWDALFDTMGVGMGAAAYPPLLRGIRSVRQRFGKGALLG
jgi:VanZ family protein